MLCRGSSGEKTKFYRVPSCQKFFFMLNRQFLFGAIAQLGERLHGMQEVVSSNLIGSTVVSYAEIGSYDYLQNCRAAVTL